MRTNRNIVIGLALIAVVAFLAWRFVRPMNIFVVSEAFERPVSTAEVPAPLQTLRAGECGACHRQIYEEWRSTIHSQAWTDPYFQTDWKFDGSQQICRNCHTPLDRQQPQRVLGFRDKDKWDPILEPNPDFDSRLQHEGVTCAACHLRQGRILGVLGDTEAPHPVRKLDDPNRVCVRCHVVGGERWDTFFRFPPCGTVAEIRAGRGEAVGRSGEAVVPDVTRLGCVDCHMPAVVRPLVAGGKARATRRHLWRGGHDPQTVKQALSIELVELDLSDPGKRAFRLTLSNIGAAHYVPTGTPDRHLTAHLRLLDRQGQVIEEQHHILKRTILWRPFIVDLWDTRLAPGEPRRYTIEWNPEKNRVHAVEAVVQYHLLEEKRRRRIGYENKEPISYEVYKISYELRAASGEQTKDSQLEARSSKLSQTNPR